MSSGSIRFSDAVEESPPVLATHDDWARMRQPAIAVKLSAVSLPDSLRRVSILPPSALPLLALLPPA